MEKKRKMEGNLISCVWLVGENDICGQMDENLL